MRKKESIGSRSARTFSVLTLGRFVALLIGIFTILVIARFLGPAGYGAYTLAYAFFALLGATNNFGFGSYLTKYLAEYEDNRDADGFGRAISSGYLSIIVVGLLLTLLGFALSGIVASALGPSGVTQISLVIVSSILFFFMLYGTSDHALIGVGMNAAAAVLEVSENIILLAASVFLILLGYGVAGALAGILISYVFAGALGTYWIFRFAHRNMHAKIDWPSRKDLRHAFGFSMPVAVNNFFSNAMVNIAALFLGFFVVASVVGNFGIAKNARNVLAIFYGTTAVTLIPTLSIAASREARKERVSRFDFVYNKALLYSLAVTVPIMVYLGVFSGPLVFLTISAYSTAPLYLALIALGTIIGLVGMYATSLFVARNKMRVLLRYTVISAAAQFLSLLALVPTFGALGAIVAVFFVGSIATTILFLIGTRRVLGIKMHYGGLLRVFLSNAVLAIVFGAGLLVSSQIAQLAYGVVALVVVYPILLIAFGAVGSEDIATFHKVAGELEVHGITRPLVGYLRALARVFGR